MSRSPIHESGNNMNFRIILDLLFPPKCPFCGRVQERSAICPACQKALPWTEAPEQEQTLPDKLRCASPLWYEGQAREGMLRYKFQGASGAADILGGLIAECAAEHFAGEFDAVTYVPVSRKRLRSRGYDQSRLLAEAACRRWDTVPETLLRKVGDNPPQSTQADEAARRANVLGMYEPVGDAAGKRILLVDDIVTTGATLCECARTLRLAGAASVVCVTVCRTRRK